MLKAYEFITGKKRKSTIAQRKQYQKLSDFPFGGNKLFYWKLEAMSTDFSALSAEGRLELAEVARLYSKQIWLLGNDILFPSETPVSELAMGGNCDDLDRLIDAVYPTGEQVGKYIGGKLGGGIQGLLGYNNLGNVIGSGVGYVVGGATFYDHPGRAKALTELDNGDTNCLDELAGVSGEDYFMSLLCNAPCEGPCNKSRFYDGLDDYPEFSCSNQPGWLGDRWDGNGIHNSTDDYVAGPHSRKFNGLDFMSLYNMFALKYLGDEPPYNPNNTQLSNTANNNGIIGPGFLCLDEQEVYSLTPLYANSTSFPTTQWVSSDEAILDIIGQIPPAVVGSEPDAVRIRGASAFSEGTIEVLFSEVRPITQYFRGAPSTTVGSTTANDECATRYSKTVYVGDFPSYQIETDFDFCGGTFEVEAIGPNLPGVIFGWEFRDFITGDVFTLNGRKVFASGTNNPDRAYSLGEITLHVILPPNVSGQCEGERAIVKQIEFESCGNQPLIGNGGGGVNVFPNPTIHEFTMVIDKDGYQIPWEGTLVRITNNISGQVAVSQRVYSKVYTFNTTLSNGNYNLQVITDGVLPISTNFVVQHD